MLVLDVNFESDFTVSMQTVYILCINHVTVSHSFIQCMYTENKSTLYVCMLIY